jgi:hypothetical protein
LWQFQLQFFPKRKQNFAHTSLLISAISIFKNSKYAYQHLEKIKQIVQSMVTWQTNSEYCRLAVPSGRNLNVSFAWKIQILEICGSPLIMLRHRCYFLWCSAMILFKCNCFFSKCVCVGHMLCYAYLNLSWCFIVQVRVRYKGTLSPCLIKTMPWRCLGGGWAFSIMPHVLYLWVRSP